MYTFNFHYANGKNHLYENITSVTVYTLMSEETVSGDAIKDFDFTGSTNLSLKSGIGNYSVSCDGLRSLDVTKEQ